VTVLRYSLLRLLLLVGCLIVLWLLGGLWQPLRDPLLLIGLTAVISVVLSYFVLRGPREAMTAQLAQRMSARTAHDGHEPFDPDADAEDAEIASAAEREPEAEQDAEGQLGPAGGTEHRHERETGDTRPDGAQRGPEQHG
jgi:hypothetical protein